MTDCSAKKGLIQLRRCQNSCSSSTIEFAHHALQEKVDKLKSKLSHKLFQDTMADLFDGIEGLESSELVQTGNPNKTAIKKVPAPQTQKLGACSDPYKGAPPPPGSKRAGGCQLTPGSCFKLQGRFLRIQAGITDEKESLQLRLAHLNSKCAEIKAVLEGKIEDCKSTLSSSSADLSDATGKESKASLMRRSVSSCA